MSKVGRRRWLEVVGDVGKVFAEKDQEEEGDGIGDVGMEEERRVDGDKGEMVQEVARPKVEREMPPKFEEIVEDDEEKEGESGLQSEGRRDLVDLESRVGLGEKMGGGAGIGRIIELP